MESKLNSQDNPDFENVRDVEPSSELLEAKNLTWIDVRQPEEFNGELKHIENAKLIPLDTLESNIHSLPSDQQVIFICRSGRRSAMACQIAEAYGFKSTYNLKGGMIAWNEQDLPVV